jgi:hypothetical protein
MKLDLFPSAAAKFRSGLILLVAFSLIASQANAVCISAFEVEIQVALLDSRSGNAPKDYSEVVVWLVPVRVLQPASLPRELPHYRIMQHNKRFEPRLLVVPVGSTVEFRNRDPWFHSAFSFSNSMRFDLGPREPGGRKAVRFNHPGAAYVFCDIHPEMEAVILAVESPYFGVSNKAGHILINNVPPGTYSLHVWYENATSQTLKGLRRAIVLDGDHRTPKIFIAMAKRVPITDDNYEHLTLD